MAGKELFKHIGPYEVGETFIIKCEVEGGSPRPNVTWLRDEKTVDNSFALSTSKSSTNILTIPSIKRADLHTIFTCQAENNNLNGPVSTSVILDMTCKS